MIEFSSKGDWSRTNSFLEKALEVIKFGELDRYGKRGVDALANATPKDTGKTAASWSYRIIHEKNSTRIEWLNSNKNKGVLIAILIQYGHGLQNGVFVEGVDYINPALRPVFDSIAEDAWKELVDE